MKNNVSIAEERQFITKEFADTIGSKTPPPYLRLHDRTTAKTKSNETSRPVGALKIKDAAQYLGGISHITVRRLIKRGLLKP
jgi:hypothetical protein